MKEPRRLQQRPSWGELNVDGAGALGLERCGDHSQIVDLFKLLVGNFREISLELDSVVRNSQHRLR